MKKLPDFRESKPDYAEQYAQTVFGERLVAVVERPNNAFRAVFAPAYFTIQPGNDAPSRSQWSTLKKRMKRVNPGVFVFKDHGDTVYDDRHHYYVDFGFLED